MRPSCSRLALSLLSCLCLASAVNAQTRDEDLFKAASAEQGPLLETLQRLVEIETGTGDAEGLAAIEDVLEAQLRGPGILPSQASDRAVGRVAELAEAVRLPVSDVAQVGEKVGRVAEGAVDARLSRQGTVHLEGDGPRSGGIGHAPAVGVEPGGRRHGEAGG